MSKLVAIRTRALAVHGEPLYGQSGGGIEIHLPNTTPAAVVATNPLPAF
jgi:hypothetical protein